VTIGGVPKVATRKWQYDALAFVSQSLQARHVATMLKSEPTTLTVAGTAISTEFQNTSFTWQRKPSLAQYDQRRLPWPSVIYKVRLVQQLMNLGHYLVGDGPAPSFPSLGGAYNAFLHDNFTLTGVQNPTLGSVTFCFVDQSARIHRVRIGPTTLDVWVGGRCVRGSYLELNSAEDRQVIEVVRPGKNSVPLPGGLGLDSWIWLKSGTSWLDYRSLNNWGGYKSQDIEEDLPVDPSAALSALLSGHVPTSGV
jgi:hypothetical protein